MNKTFTSILIVVAVLAVAGAVFFAGTMYGRVNAFGPFNMMRNSNYSMPMMNGNGMPMMGGNGYKNSNLSPLTVDQAKAAAEKYLANLNNPDLKIAEVMIFDNNAYIVVKEASTGNGAFELLADSSSPVAYPEHGPNMMWNLKYGGLNHQNMMSGNNMMGGYGGMMSGNGGMTLAPGASAGVNGYTWDNTTSTDLPAMTITAEKAIEIAQKYLDANIKNAVAADDPIQFPGYYTLDYKINGKVAGMLSVNGYTGQVFPHTWHGNFIEETTIE